LTAAIVGIARVSRRPSTRWARAGEGLGLEGRHRPHRGDVGAGDEGPAGARHDERADLAIPLDAIEDRPDRRR
jgi:hypothetical protein